MTKKLAKPKTKIRKDPSWLTHRNFKGRCLCGCKVKVTGRAYYASPACRKRKERADKKMPLLANIPD